MNIILATRNPSKALQIRECFLGSPIKILTLSDVGIVGEAEEDGTTLEQNALKKVMFAHQESHKSSSENSWIMADDTGLFIRALNNEPGVQAAYWAGRDAETEEITAHAIQMLTGVTDRHAIFRAVVCVMNPNGEIVFFTGEVDGVMLDTPRVKPQPKMPYSGLFQPVGHNKVWAEMTTEEENAISHRGIAFRQVRAYLETFTT